MPCGCENTCGCHILDDGGLTTRVVNKGDTFTVYAIPAIAGVADTDCIQLDLDADKVLTATPVLADGDSVQLSCTPSGVKADVVIDPSSTAVVTSSAAGLKVDVPPTPGDATTGVAPGDIVPFAGIRLPVNRVECFGQPLQASVYPEAYDALTLFGEAATVTSGSAIVTGIDSTRFIEVGMTLTGDGFSTPRTIVSVDSSTQVTVDGPASYTVVGTATIRVHVWGFYAIDPSFFIAPDLRDEAIAGMGNMGASPLGGASAESLLLGGTAGSNDAVLGSANLPLHTHTADVTDPGHGHAFDDPGHDHGGVTDDGGIHGHAAPDNAGFATTDKSRRFVVVGNGDALDHPLTQVGVDDGGGGTTRSFPLGPADGGGATWAQGTSSFTAPSAAHHHVINSATTGATILTDTTGITVTIEDAGSATPDAVDVRQRTTYMRLTMVV